MFTFLWCATSLTAQEFPPPLIVKIDSVNQSIQMAYSPDGTTIAVSTREGAAELRDPVTGDVQKTMEPVHNIRFLRNMQYSVTGDSLIVGTDDGRLVMWDVAMGTIVYEEVVADTDIWRFHLTVDGKYLVVIDFNAVVYVIDRGTGERLFTHGTETEPAYDFNT